MLTAKISRISALLGCSMFALVAVNSAQAQSKADGVQAMDKRSGGLEDIVVTAQRRAERMQGVPIAVSAATEETLAATATSSVLQMEKIAPSLQVLQIAGASTIFLRGVGSSESTPGFESAVALYLDGVYQGSKNVNVFDLTNIERIEVLKGPQGTLFGRNATGGAVNIVTKDPESEPVVSAEFGWGRFNEKRARFYASAPITDTLSANIAAAGRWDDGYIFNPYRDVMQNPSRQIAASAKLLWQPTDRLSVRLSGGYSEVSDPSPVAYHPVRGTIPAAVPLGGLTTYDDYENAADARMITRVTGTRATLGVDYDLDSVRLVSISGYIKGGAKGRNDTDATTRTRNSVAAWQPAEQFSQEFQIQSNNDSRLEWIAGAYYMYLKEGFDNLMIGSNVPSPIRPEDLQVPGQVAVGIRSFVKTDALAGFVQGTYSFSDSDRLTLGVRYSTEDKRVTGEQFLYAAVPAVGNQNIKLQDTVLGSGNLVFGETLLATLDRSRRFSKVTWRISYDHKFSEDILTYLSYNRGFKSGTYNPTVINNTQTAVKPEVIDAFEAGFKSEFFGRKLRFNAAAFYYDYENIQIGLITGVGTTTVQNAASARLYGMDFDVAAAPFDGFKINAAFSYIDSKYKNFTNAAIFLPRSGAACSPGSPSVTPAQAKAIYASATQSGVCSYSLNASGQDLVFSPKWSGSIAAEYEIPVAGTGAL